MDKKREKPRLLDWPIIRWAVVAALKKLNPRDQWHNPVMFVVYVGSILTTILGVHAMLASGEAPAGFIFAVSVWLWFTVLFANFAEAMAEGRAKAHADTLRKSRTEVTARRLIREDEQLYEVLSAGVLKKGDVVLVMTGEVLPGDGEVIKGAASVDESAVTGESAPVIRESGGDRSAVTGGTRVVPRPHDRDGRGREAPEDAQRDRPEHSPGRLDHRLPGRLRNAAAVLALRR
jgi:K+-transporting ATPase ATPase B chain